MHPSTKHILQFFKWRHLPPDLQLVSQGIADVAEMMAVDLPDNPEKTAGLRKLLEAKDCFVRAKLAGVPKDVEGETDGQKISP